MDAQIQLIQVSPEQLADLISDNVNKRIKDLFAKDEKHLIEIVKSS